jgi:hypothetical protein
MSFAAKIQAPAGEPNAASAQRMILNNNVTAVASAWKKGQHDPEAQQEPDAPVQAPPAPAAVNSVLSTLAATPQSGSNQPAPVPVQKAELPAAASAIEAPLAAPPQHAAGQLKDVSFRIAQPDGSTVQLRLMQQSGELKVAVHTASPDLNQGLRDSLPDLTKKLADNGFHSETWRPGVSAAPAAAESEASKNSGNNSNGGDAQSQSGAGQQGRGQRDQNQSQRPQWVEELEIGMQSAPSSTTGELHGIVS